MSPERVVDWIIDCSRVGYDMVANFVLIFRIHVIDLKEKVLKKSIELPIPPEAHGSQENPAHVLFFNTKFLKIHSEIFIVSQTNTDMRVRIVS